MKQDIWADSYLAPLDDPSNARSPLLDAKVMMVDDEILMTELIQAHLEDAGYANFVVTNDPREALAMLRREQPGVLLLDLMMPHLSGFELLETIRADHKLRYLPVIVLTAATGADSKLRALQLGATDFLSKPVDASELVLRLRNTLAFHQYHNRMVNFDSVTGLPTQRLFDRGVDEMVSRRGQVGGMVGVFSVHVPECRSLRESIGQASADELAKTIARRLDRFAGAMNPALASSTSTASAPRVARLSGEQFALLLEGLPDAETITLMTRRLLTDLAEPVALGLHELAPTALIGIAVSPGDGDTAEALRKGADVAVTHARQIGTTQFAFASAELEVKSLERVTLGSQLRGAAQRGELVLHYQPKVEMASNRVVGMEALVRWQHPEHGLMAPARFIALAEELGLIAGVGQWVIEQACRDAAQWSRDGYGELSVSVNVAKPQFLAGDLVSLLRNAMATSGLPARLLVVELTESMLMTDVPSGMALMHELKALGITLSLDDFGTGYSSLSYLKNFPIDELKIDRSFVTDLPGAAADVAIARAVIALGHSLGMSVIAEGVETVQQLECLKQLGCDDYQGFLFSTPLPAQQLVELLARTDAAIA